MVSSSLADEKRVRWLLLLLHPSARDLSCDPDGLEQSADFVARAGTSDVWQAYAGQLRGQSRRRQCPRILAQTARVSAGRAARQTSNRTRSAVCGVALSQQLQLPGRGE